MHLHRILVDSCDVAFDTSGWWNRPKTVPVIGMASMVTSARVRCTQDYLTTNIFRIIKPAAMEKFMSFTSKINIGM